MAERPREKPPRPTPSRPAPPRVASDNEATVFAQPKPKVASVVHEPNPDAAPISNEGTMMMVGGPGRATSPLPNPPATAVPTQPQGGGLESTMAMNVNNIAELRGRVPNSQPPPAYSGEVRNVVPNSQPPPPYVAQAGSVAPPPNNPHPRLGSGAWGGPGMPVASMPPMQQRPPMQVPQAGPAPYRAPPPPPAPPGIVLQSPFDPRLVLAAEPESARATSFRLLRDNLLARRLPRVIAISSALPADGKTTCAMNLALSLSEGARVLLVDGNLLEPELDEIFGITDATIPSAVNGPWAAPYKIAELSPSMSIAAIVLPPGVPPPRFERRWFETFVVSLRRMHYDFILIDTPALSASPTVSQIVAIADGTLLAVRAGVTTARALRRATEQIPEAKAMGVALIDAKPTT